MLGRALRVIALALFTTSSALAQTPAHMDGPVCEQVRPNHGLSFPADHGAHPAFRTEWWYVTGWLQTPDGPKGFQITFFRSRPPVEQGNPSAFSPKQIILAHIALSDPAVGKLIQDQRIARQGFGLANAASNDTDIVLGTWRLVRGADGVFSTNADAAGFALKLRLQPTQPVLLQGDRGYSAKGASAAQASYYYSLPHLSVSGSLRQAGRTVAVNGEAWLDHEWSSNFLVTRSAGWDWTGLNLDDGGSLTAFQLRDVSGKPIWAGGSYRSSADVLVNLKPGDISFSPNRSWRSPRTGTMYPVVQSLKVKLPSGTRQFSLTPLFDDQELDTRNTGGPVYWEGAVRTGGGKGYLEMVGYSGAINLQ